MPKLHVRGIITNRADAIFVGAIALCALVIVLMPLTTTIRHQFMYAMHGRAPSPVVFAGVQVVPKMYNFANHYWLSPTPLSREQLLGDPAALKRVEFGWINHYPIWMMTHYWRVLLKDHGLSSGYFYLGSTWRGEHVWTGYHVRHEVLPNGDERAYVERADP